MGCWAAVVHLWQDHRFADPRQEAEFQSRWMQLSSRLCSWWLLSGGGLVLVASVLATLRPRVRQSLVLFLPALVAPAFLFLAAAAGMRLSRLCQAHVLHVASALCLLAVAICGWLLPQLVHLDTLSSHDLLQEVFGLLEGHPTELSTLETYIREVTTAQDFWPAMFYFYSYFHFLHFFAYTKLFHVVYFSMPVMLLVTSSFHPYVAAKTYNIFAGSMLAACTGSASTVYIALLRRQHFRADYDWQQSLAKEARAMQELARQEAQHKESAQEADSILNHSLKNMMADAAGCIHMYAAGLPGPLPADLAQALACLDRGMGWCRKRQALLRLADGRYTPTLAAVRLPDMGQAVVHGRDVACSFADAAVLLDPVLCDLVLDNGIDNAFRHGDPEDPAVHFTITATEAVDGRQFLTFEVANRTHPDRPVVTPELVERLFRGQEERPLNAPALSEHLGLQHMFMAAQAHGMALTLEQHADWVTLRGVLEVPAALETPFLETRATTPQEGPLSLPPGTHVFCVDDSEIARRLLAHTFGLLPSPPVVRTFGGTAREVEAFLAEAPLAADVVILDQHLDYGAVHYRGTDLLQQLVHDGFEGLVCIRSANVTPENQHTFLESGAHCAVGKDVSPSVLVSTVLQAFFQHSTELVCRVPLSPCTVATLHTGHSQEFTPVVMPRDVLPGSTQL
eukprot:EG_transcript_3074